MNNFYLLNFDSNSIRRQEISMIIIYVHAGLKMLALNEKIRGVHVENGVLFLKNPIITLASLHFIDWVNDLLSKTYHAFADFQSFLKALEEQNMQGLNLAESAFSSSIFQELRIQNPRNLANHIRGNQPSSVIESYLSGVGKQLRQKAMLDLHSHIPNEFKTTDFFLDHFLPILAIDKRKFIKRQYFDEIQPVRDWMSSMSPNFKRIVNQDHRQANQLQHQMHNLYIEPNFNIRNRNYRPHYGANQGRNSGQGRRQHEGPGRHQHGGPVRRYQQGGPGRHQQGGQGRSERHLHQTNWHSGRVQKRTYRRNADHHHGLQHHGAPAASNQHFQVLMATLRGLQEKVDRMTDGDNRDSSTMDNRCQSSQSTATASSTELMETGKIEIEATLAKLQMEEVAEVTRNQDETTIPMTGGDNASLQTSVVSTDSHMTSTTVLGPTPLVTSEFIHPDRAANLMLPALSPSLQHST